MVVAAKIVVTEYIVASKTTRPRSVGIEEAGDEEQKCCTFLQLIFILKRVQRRADAIPQ